jgi:hypothetical protein
MPLGGVGPDFFDLFCHGTLSTDCPHDGGLYNFVIVPPSS